MFHWYDAVSGYVEHYYAFARGRGAARLVITGGGEPLLRPDDVVDLIARGREFFPEIACFTNGTFLTASLARQMKAAGLSYLCYSRHHDNEDQCRRLMGDTAPKLDEFFANAQGLKVRATCVMTKGFVDSIEAVHRYMANLSRYGVTEFTWRRRWNQLSAGFDHLCQGRGWQRLHPS